MNAKQLILAAAVFAAAGSTLADQTSPYVEFNNTAHGKTRAEVRAELEQAYAQDHFASARNPEFVEFTQVVSTRTRDEVRQEAIQAARPQSAQATKSGS